MCVCAYVCMHACVHMCVYVCMRMQWTATGISVCLALGNILELLCEVNTCLSHAQNMGTKQ